MRTEAAPADAWSAPVEPEAAAGWHGRGAEAVAKAFDTNLETGLAWREARRREAANRGEAPRARNAVARILFNHVKGGVIIVLLLASAVTWLLGHKGDSVGIAVSVLFSVVCGFLTDNRAERALVALKNPTAPTARVIREGLEHEVPALSLRPGDVRVLGAGHIARVRGTVAPGRSADMSRAQRLLVADLERRAEAVQRSGAAVAVLVRLERAAGGGGLLFVLAGVLLVAACVGREAGPVVVGLMTFGSALALFLRA